LCVHETQDRAHKLGRRCKMKGKQVQCIGGITHERVGHSNEDVTRATAEAMGIKLKKAGMGTCLLIPQVRLAHKYPIPPWEMIHLPGGDNAVGR
jgi:hypothetical protein